MKKTFIFATVLLLPAPLLAEITASLYSSGPILTCHGKGETEGGHDTVDGEIVVQPGRELEERAPIFASQSVPAQVGISFGFYACGTASKDPIALTGTVSHPPMNFHGKTTTQQSWPIVRSPKRSDHTDEEVCSFVGYQVEDTFELVLGNWAFSLWDNEELLLTETLKLVERTELSFDCQSIQ